MGSNKKNNTAVKNEQDFETEILAEELKGVLKSVPDQNADDFFNALKEEMLEEGVVLENSIVQEMPEEEFTNVDIVPKDLKLDLASDELESENLKTEIGSPVDLKESHIEDELLRSDLNSAPIAVEEENESPVTSEKVDFSKEEVDAAVDEIFGDAAVGASPKLDENTNPIRVFEDKTSTLKKFPDVTAMMGEDKTQDLSNLENVSSMESAKAEMFHHVAKRNPSIDLKNADYIKFAQGKIKNLEKELVDLRIETQELALAGSHFKALADEREQRNKSLEAKVSELQSTSVEEKKILNSALEAKETKISLLLDRVESLEVELESKYNRLRVRERELESRLEILKQEQDAVASSKDDLILRVKKQNNALTADLERARAQSQKSSSLLQEKEDALRRTIRALKLSLTMLESQKQ